MCIRMLQILNTGRVYKVSELADLLETNPRNILEYKKELNEVATECGYEFFIDTVPGRDGGYKLNGHVIIPSLSLTHKEKEALVEGMDYLMARNDFMAKKDYPLAIGKIISSLIMEDIKKDESISVINRFPLSMSEDDIANRYKIFQEAIKFKRKVKFKYLSQKNVVTERLFDPYELFMYNNAYFVIGWNNSQDDNSGVRWFKLNRIQEIEMTTERFNPWTNYHKNDYLDEYGFKSNGEWYHVEFIAYGTYAALCKERIYGKNQIVESIDENSTKVSVDMQNQESIRVFILGFGKNVEVLEPDWLKNDLLNIGQHLAEIYKE